MLKSKSKLILMLALSILGYILAIQFRSTLYSSKQRLPVSAEISVLKENIQREKQVGQTLIEQIKNAEKTNRSLLDYQALSSHNDAVRNLIATRDILKRRIGLTDVKGSGIIIELMDAPKEAKVSPLLAIIHYSDVMKVVNELKKAGAQAICINDERVIWSSEQICAGPTIRINNNRYPIPYIIKSTGDPNQLYEGVAESSIVSALFEAKIRVRIEKSKEVVIPAYRHSTDNLINGLEVIDIETG